MIRVMVVEDDLLTRIGIATILKSEGTIYELVAEADNGKSALIIALRECPDIIITDVQMPLMNGIEFIKAVKQAGLKSRFIILSAYKDFEYVREGIMLGAEDYLLKLELDKQKLLSVLKKVSTKLQDEYEEMMSVPKDTTLEYEFRDDYTKARCVYSIVTDRFDDQEIIRSALDTCGLSICEYNLVCVLALKEISAQSSPVDTYASEQILRTLIGLLQNYGEGYGCMIDTNLFCLLVSVRDAANQPIDATYSDKISNDLAEYINNTLNVSIRVSVSEPVGSFRQIAEFFSKNCVYENGHYFLVDTRDSSDNAGTHSTFAAELSLLEAVLKNNNIDDIDRSFSVLLDAITQTANVSAKSLHSICYLLIYFTDGYFVNHSYISNEWSRSKMLLKLNNRCCKTSDYVEFITSLRDMLVSFVESIRDYKLAVVRAEQFIRNNFSRDLSLDEVASHVNLSSSYFSRIFSQVTGQNFVTFLTNVRIERAKELLRSSNAKIRSISESVGYSNTYYFCRVFKKETGNSPIEYRSLNH